MTTGSKMMQIELYRPIPTGHYPLLVMLHGSAGAYTVRSVRAPHPSNFGEDSFARDCYVVALPHYFDALGTSSITDPARLAQSFLFLKQVIVNVISTEADLFETRNQPIMLYGESYGGFLAVSIAGDDRRIAALSVYGTALPDNFHPSLRQLPPLLIQQGEDDTIVPVEGALRLRDTWARRKAPVRYVSYPGVGHYFSEESRKLLLETTHSWLTHSTVGTNAP